MKGEGCTFPWPLVEAERFSLACPLTGGAHLGTIIIPMPMKKQIGNYRLFATRIINDRAVLLLSRAIKRHACLQGSVAKILQKPILTNTNVLQMSCYILTACVASCTILQQIDIHIAIIFLFCFHCLICKV